MTIHVLDLAGCAPQPLAHYLKALGILRLVTEQKDPGARGWWEGERFRLASSLDQGALRRFFLEEYRPTPLVAPWGKGSGFYKTDDPALTPVAESTAMRLAPYRQAIEEARLLLSQIRDADAVIRAVKARTKTTRAFQSEEQRLLLQRNADFTSVLQEVDSERRKASDTQDNSAVERAEAVTSEIKALATQVDCPPTKKDAQTIKKSDGYKRLLAAADRRFKSLKADLIPACRRAWRGEHRDWMDCALVLNQDGEAAYPALLGTGGNDGKLDFTNKFMQRLAVVFDLSDAQAKPMPKANAWLEHALYGSPIAGLLTGKEGKVGQFLPSGAGGANSTTGFGDQDDTLLNPFDYILLLEGAVLFAAALTKRGTIPTGGRVAAPFTVGSHAAGYASAGASDEGSRGEQWMPLWSRPMCLADLRHLIAEGRAQIGSLAAKEPLDLARAVARLGTSRGIAAFQRYAYIERNGQSNLAVPLGRFTVPTSSDSRLSALDDLDAWLARLRREARDDHAPARLKHAEHRLSDALFALVQHPGEAARWQTVLLALVAVEGVMVSGSGFAAGPVPHLRPAWALAADDGSTIVRLALACALQTAGWVKDRSPVDGVRRHWLPLDRTRFKTRTEGRRPRLLTDPGVVMTGRDGCSDAVALVERRLVDAAQRGQRRLPLQAGRHADARLDDLALVVAGEVDLDQTMALARAFMALDAKQWTEAPPCLTRHPMTGAVPDDAWLAIRLSLLPWPLKDGRRIGCDPAIVRRLAAGDAATAVDLALRRLRAGGLRTTVRGTGADTETARRWAAALVFPVTQRTAERMVRRLDPSFSQEESHAH